MINLSCIIFEHINSYLIWYNKLEQIMNNNEVNSNYELPAVQPDKLNNLDSSSDTREVINYSPEMYNHPTASNLPSVSSATVAVNNSVASNDNSSLSSDDSSNQSNPTIADDNDLIEKEWVIKAKQIVAATKNDPFKQNYEISKFKADYLKKRYGKEIKVEER